MSLGSSSKSKIWKVLLDPCRCRRLGEDDIPALNAPAKHDLRRGPSSPTGDRADRRIVENPAFRKRRPRRRDDSMFGVRGPDLLVAQVWMHFDLVDGRYDVALLHEAPHVRDLKV
jgi:hypothetical protein